MRKFSFLGKKTNLHEVRIPVGRLDRINQSLKRRLDDDIEGVFNRACASNDLEAATDLLRLLEKQHARRAPGLARERRVSSANLQQARRDLERLAALRCALAPAQPVEGSR